MATCRNFWDQTNVAFRAFRNDEAEAAKQMCAPEKECISCGLQQLRLLHSSWSLQDGHVTHRNMEYHVLDFVYLRPSLSAIGPTLYIIGQITELTQEADGEPQAVIRLVERYDIIAARSAWGPFKSPRKTHEVSCIVGLATIPYSHITATAGSHRTGGDPQHFTY